MDVKGGRMTVEFSEHQQDALMRLASDMHTSKVGVLRAAVSLLALVHREASTGGRFAVVQDGHHRLPRERMPARS
jgi:hypothetical protein